MRTVVNGRRGDMHRDRTPNKEYITKLASREEYSWTGHALEAVEDGSETLRISIYVSAHSITVGLHLLCVGGPDITPGINTIITLPAKQTELWKLKRYITYKNRPKDTTHVMSTCIPPKDAN